MTPKPLWEARVGFGAYLRKMRTTLGLSLRTMAADVGVSFSYLCKLETGERPAPPTLKVLQRIAAAYGVDARELLREAGFKIEDATPNPQKPRKPMNTEVIEALITEVCTQKESAADALAYFACRTPVGLAPLALSECFAKILAHYAAQDREREFNARRQANGAGDLTFDYGAETRLRVVRTLIYEAKAKDMDGWLALSLPVLGGPHRFPARTLTITQSDPEDGEKPYVPPAARRPSVITYMDRFHITPPGGVESVAIFAVMDDSIVDVKYQFPMPQPKDDVLGLCFGVKAVPGLAEALADDIGDPDVAERIAALICVHCRADLGWA